MITKIRFTATGELEVNEAKEEDIEAELYDGTLDMTDSSNLDISFVVIEGEEDEEDEQ